MSQVLVSSLEDKRSLNHSSEGLARLAEHMRPFTEKFLTVLKGGKDETLAFLHHGKVNGAGLSKSDRELMLHFTALELISLTLAEPKPKNDADDLDRKTQWENLIAALLVDARGNVAAATRTPAFRKACDAAVRTLEQVHTLETVLEEVPPPGKSTPTRGFVHTLINTLEGQITSSALEGAPAMAMPELGRGALKEFGRILCGRLAVGPQAAARFLQHELADSVGMNSIDREIVLHFATRELIERSLGRDGKSVSSAKAALSWSALFGLVVACGKQAEEIVTDTHTPMLRAFEEALRGGCDLTDIEKLLPMIASDRHQVYLRHLITSARNGMERRKAA